MIKVRITFFKQCQSYYTTATTIYLIFTQFFWPWDTVSF